MIYEVVRNSCSLPRWEALQLQERIEAEEAIAKLSPRDQEKVAVSMQIHDMDGPSSENQVTCNSLGTETLFHRSASSSTIYVVQTLISNQFWREETV
jgi:hypothetical protein